MKSIIIFLSLIWISNLNAQIKVTNVEPSEVTKQMEESYQKLKSGVKKIEVININLVDEHVVDAPLSSGKPKIITEEDKTIYVGGIPMPSVGEAESPITKKYSFANDHSDSKPIFRDVPTDPRSAFKEAQSKSKEEKEDVGEETPEAPKRKSTYTLNEVVVTEAVPGATYVIVNSTQDPAYAQEYLRVLKNRGHKNAFIVMDASMAKYRLCIGYSTDKEKIKSILSKGKEINKDAWPFKY